MIAGYAIHTSEHLVVRVPYPRSPARAKRRARLGHPQHHVTRPDPRVYMVGGAMHMHPAIYAQLRAELRARPL